jgi:hypothetical protein
MTDAGILLLSKSMTLWSTTIFKIKESVILGKLTVHSDCHDALADELH